MCSSDLAAGDDVTITLANAVVAKGETLTINGSGLNQASNDARLVFDGSAETNGSYIITTAGTTDHSVILGNGADTYTGSGSGATTVTATAGTNSITTGTGADTITAGSGADTMTGGTGSDIFAFGSAANALGDSVTDFVSANDQIGVTLDYSALLGAVTVNGVRTGAGVAGTTAVEATLTGQRGEYAYDTTSSKLIVNANADAAVSGADIQVSINAAATAANTIAAGDVNFTVTGTGFNDVFVTGAGADTINAGAGANDVDVGVDAVADLVNVVSSVTTTTNTIVVYNLDTTDDEIALVNGAGVADGTDAGALVNVAGLAGLTIDDVIADTAANLGASAVTVGDQSATFTDRKSVV